MTTYRLLSFDGGGIRGYISASILAELDKATDGKLISRIHGVSGTSTGGLIALGLAAGMTGAELVKLYREHADEIFAAVKDHGFGWAEMEAAKLLGFPDPRLLFHAKYSSNGLKHVLSKYLDGKTFADADFDIAVNTARLWDDGVTPPRWRATTPNSFDADTSYRNVPLLDLACATTAAPTYFPPHLIGDLGYFADGGMFGNNPSLNMFAALNRAGKVDGLDKIEIISFGTGLAPTGISPDSVGDPMDWGISRWLYPTSKDGRPKMPLMSGMFDMGGSSTDEIAQGLFGDQIRRVQPILKHPVALDDVDAAAFDAMDKAIAETVETPAFIKACAMARRWTDGA